MAGPSKKDQVNPPLMSVFRSAFAARDSKKRIDLRDEGGERIIASRRSARRAAITEPALRREVARDLEGLMNTIALDASQPLDGFDQVRSSVLNYGFPDIAHRSIDENSVNDIRDEIRTVLKNYEPRLVGDSVKVARDGTVNQAALKIRFTVTAELLCDPVNVPVEFIAEVEMDSGKIQISRF